MTQEEPTFITCCYSGDWHLCLRLMSQLVMYHKRSKRIIITDGKLPESQKKILMGSCHHFVEGVSLGRDWSQPTAWLKRLLRIGIEQATGEIIIKVDPDSYFTRRINSYPDYDLFGSGSDRIQGGIYGIRKKAAQKILDQGILDLPDLQLCNGYSSLGSWEDEQISRCIGYIKGTKGGWNQVHSRFKPEFRRTQINSDFAVWHPLKDL